MDDQDLTEREKLHTSLSRWVSAHNILGQVTTFSVGFPSEFDDDPALDPVSMYEIPAVELRQLLAIDAAARAGHAPDSGDEADGIRAAGARLKYLLEESVRTSGWPQPRDAAQALGEMARLTDIISALVAEADRLLGRELRAGRVTPVPSAGAGRATTPTNAAAQIHDTAAAAMSKLGEATAQLRQLQKRASELQRTMRAAVALTSDGPSLRSQYLVRCSPTGWTGCYHVRVFEPVGQIPLVILGELGDNHSTHLNHAVEAVAATVTEHLLGARDPDAVAWVQYEPAEEFYSRYEEDENADATSYDREDQAYVIEFAAGFAKMTRRQRVDQDQVQRLAGGPVRRWHVYDYTMANVAADGAQLVSLPSSRPRRKHS